MMTEKDVKYLELRLFINKVLKNCHHYNNNYIMVFIGPTGSGKSWASLRLGELLDPDNFGKINKEGYPNQVTFDPYQFANMLHQTQHRGAYIMLEEAGVSIDAQQWWNKTNKLIKYFAQTIRYKNQIMSLTVPSFKFVDSGVRTLIDEVINCGDIDFQTNLHRVYPRKEQVNYKDPTKTMGIRHKGSLNKGNSKLQTVPLKPPSVKLRHAYEKLKHDWNESFREKELTSFNATDIKDGKLTARQYEIYELYVNGGKSLADISGVLGITPQVIGGVLGAIRKKTGYACKRGAKRELPISLRPNIEKPVTVTT